MSVVPKYYLALREAQHASEAVDMFDLRSESLESCIRFEQLRTESFLAQMRLIALVRSQPDLLADIYAINLEDVLEDIKLAGK